MNGKIMEGYNLYNGWLVGLYDEKSGHILAGDWYYPVIKSTVHEPGTERPAIAL
jgi:hypothetical protein